MSCGHKIETTGLKDERDMADRLRSDGYSDIARKVERGDCLDDRDVRRMTDSLNHQGLYERVDYRLRECECDHDLDF